VALKILPPSQSKDPDAVARFYREARAVACLNHPNIVRCHDIDCERDLHFIVLEYVDGSNMHDIVRRHGPMAIVRAAHYIRQAALGLQHAHESGLVHRDIKPGNILLDRNGVVKLLDMGLARFFDDEEENLSYDQEAGSALGTADYVAPEQVHDSRVDIRADIYGLGVTFYYLLSGKSPFSQGTVAQKLIWHQVRQPKPIRAIRPEVPQELADIVDKMMAKDAADRFQIPAEVAETLDPWTQTAIPPPPEEEMPSLDFGPRSSGTGSNNTPISRTVLSPLGIRGSPPTPISRAPKILAPRTVLRAPAPSVPDPAAPVPADAAVAAIAQEPALAPPTPQPEVASDPAADVPSPAPAVGPMVEDKPLTPETTEPAPVNGDSAPEETGATPPPPSNVAKPSAVAEPQAVKDKLAPETKPNLASKAPTKLSPPKKSTAQPPRQPALAPARKPTSDSKRPAPLPKPAPPSAKRESKAKVVAAPTPANTFFSSGNVWIVAGAAILAAGVVALIWALV
jgi:serine/threonine protein kinase